MSEAATVRRDRRKEKGLTLADLAEATGRSIGQLSRIENQGTDSISVARKLADKLDLPLESFAKPEGSA
jgi:transcriptional regulator with XRE-family HTH domain